jgi:photosystem II stability/assembly factor-like uncharacterized protein
MWRFYLFLVCFLLISSTHYAQWFWQNPLPQGNYLRKVMFVSESEGWIVGHSGTILHTTDGGDSWSFQKRGTNDYFTDLHFIDNNYGTVVGLNGKILRTTDGGKNWQNQVSGTHYGLNSVFFINENKGFAVGSYNTPYPNSYGVILSTTNGGNTWLVNNRSEGLYEVYFANNNFGMMTGFNVFYGGFFLKSTDSGKNWEKIQLPANVSDYFYGIHFLDENTGWIVGVYGTIIKTIDGGVSWNVKSFGDFYLRAVDFSNEQNGITVGTYGFSSNPGGSILVTTNSGFSWVKKAFPEHLSGISFFTNNKAVAVGAFGSIYKTIDSGLTWKSVHKGYRNDLKDITFINKEIWFAAGGNSTSGIILKTSNGGENWNEIYSANKQVNSLFFINENSGTAVGSSGLVLRTSDAGINWSVVSSYTGVNLFNVSFNGNRGIIVGQNGTILLTSDGGTTWILQNSITNHDLHGISWVDENRIIVCGKEGIIFKSDDGGSEWTLVESGMLKQLNTLYFPDSRNGFIAGYEGLILKTSDGGDSWLTANSGSSRELTNIYFSDANNGIVVGHAGTILRTSDAGSSWISEDPVTDHNLFRVKYAENIGMIVGNGGTILNNFKGGVITASHIEELPEKKFTLDQNYPNPFNPSTVISYSIPGLSFVSLKIYDILGKEISALVNEVQPAGNYQINFAADNLPAGVYFYRINAGNFNQTKKMVLLK